MPGWCSRLPRLPCLVAQAPAPGETPIPRDVDLAHPVYETTFERESALQDWVLEGGRRMRVAGGNRANNLVCWLKCEMPADFLFAFTVRGE